MTEPNEPQPLTEPVQGAVPYPGGSRRAYIDATREQNRAAIVAELRTHSEGPVQCSTPFRKEQHSYPRQRRRRRLARRPYRRHRTSNTASAMDQLHPGVVGHRLGEGHRRTRCPGCILRREQRRSLLVPSRNRDRCHVLSERPTDLAACSARGRPVLVRPPRLDHRPDC